MEHETQNKVTYQGHKVKPSLKKYAKFNDEKKPIIGTSNYQKSYPNWRNGQGDIFHEKEPQFPFYSLPFKGESNYK